MERAGRGRGLAPRRLGYSAPPPHAHNMAGRGARRSRGDPQWPLPTPPPRGSAAQPRPSSRRTPGDPSLRPGGAGFGELSRVALPAPPCSIEGSAGFFPPNLEIMFLAPPLIQRRGSSFPTSRCSWGTSFLPPRLWGRGDGVFAFPRYPDVENPCASLMTGEGVSNLSFRSCTWGVSSPSPSSLMFCLGKGITFPLRAVP